MMPTQPEPIVLVNKVCQRCGREQAEKYRALCQQCSLDWIAEQRRSDERQLLEQAEFMHPESVDLEGPLHDLGSNWYEDVETAFEQLDEALPPYLWVSVVKHRGIDPERVIEEFLEDSYEDAECDPAGERELREFVEHWNRDYALTIWTPTTKQAVVFDTDAMRSLLVDLGLPERCADVPDQIAYAWCAWCNSWQPKGSFCEGVCLTCASRLAERADAPN